MRLGIDVDGILADFNTAFIPRVITVTGRDLFPPRPFDIPVWDYPAHYGYSKEENTAVWKSITADRYFWYDLEPYDDIAASIVYLGNKAAQGHDLYFITSRPGLAAKAQTEAWLYNQFRQCDLYRNLPAITVLISSAKGLCARALQLDAYIDDRWENCLEVAVPTKTCLLHRSWNAEQAHDAMGIHRVHTLVGFADL